MSQKDYISFQPDITPVGAAEARGTKNFVDFETDEEDVSTPNGSVLH